MPGRGVIKLCVPGELRYRDVAVRLVTAACRLVGPGRTPNGGPQLDLSDRFDAEVVSAFSEIFNNIAIHGYATGEPGEVDIELTPATDHLAITITDTGASFDPAQVAPPELELLPEGGMGIHIARACVDVLDYSPGPPRNVWRLTKYTSPPTTVNQV